MEREEELLNYDYVIYLNKHVKYINMYMMYMIIDYHVYNYNHTK